MSKSFDRQITKSGAKRAQIEVDLLKKGSINDLIAALESYKAAIPDMAELAVGRLLRAGYKVATERLQNAGYGDSKRTDKFEFSIEKDGTKIYGTLFINPITITDANGKEFTPYLAWEFGAGIFYNEGSVHPKAEMFGLGVGTYPGQRHAMEDGWFYHTADGELHYTHGTEATMPLYHASLEMIQQAEKIIQGAFW